MPDPSEVIKLTDRVLAALEHTDVSTAMSALISAIITVNKDATDTEDEERFCAAQIADAIFSGVEMSIEAAGEATQVH